jgi:hypothetical protein
MEKNATPETMPSFRRGLWIVLGVVILLAGLYFLAPKTIEGTSQADSSHTFPSQQTIDLRIDAQAMQELERRRAVALGRGVLQEEGNSWVRAELMEGADKWDVRLRLKGDWTDHLQARKWSFRVEVRGNAAWRGLTAFSLQSPRRRNFLDEWLFHQVLTREGVLTPRYDFIRLLVRGEDWGTYAVEEHFTEQLLSSQGRPEGPLLKFDEDGMWDARVEALRDSAFPYLQIPFQEAATVLPFQRSRTLRDSTQRMQFIFANQLLDQFRHGSALPEEVFDLDVVARQYALTDLFSAYHSLIWHNRRFYYTPMTARLEPVVFDAFSGEGEDSYIEGPIWGHLANGWEFAGGYHDLWGDFVFRDPVFVGAYYGYLGRYSSPAFLDSIWAELGEELREREVFLRSEFGYYRFSRARWEARAREIREYLASK